MWQTAAVLLILAVVLVYVVRHYAGVYRGEVPACSSCSAGNCAARATRGVQGTGEACDCPEHSTDSVKGGPSLS